MCVMFHPCKVPPVPPVPLHTMVYIGKCVGREKTGYREREREIVREKAGAGIYRKRERDRWQKKAGRRDSEI